MLANQKSKLMLYRKQENCEMIRHFLDFKGFGEHLAKMLPSSCAVMIKVGGNGSLSEAITSLTSALNSCLDHAIQVFNSWSPIYAVPIKFAGGH